MNKKRTSCHDAGFFNVHQPHDGLCSNTRRPFPEGDKSIVGFQFNENEVIL
jgi:hypothetical protein